MTKQTKLGALQWQALGTYFPEGFYATPKEASLLKGITPRNIRQWIEKGWLKSIYSGGVHHIAINELIAFEPPKPGPKVKRKGE